MKNKDIFKKSLICSSIMGNFVCKNWKEENCSEGTACALRHQTIVATINTVTSLLSLSLHVFTFFELFFRPDKESFKKIYIWGQQHFWDNNFRVGSGYPPWCTQYFVILSLHTTQLLSFSPPLSNNKTPL